ncbi:hypothetical protein SAMN05518871_103476 [Psychrobacillus sp. OK028]|nr:hypothetical protein SAMN05518871_103476 [Psychrobacillus sp. OK028]
MIWRMGIYTFTTCLICFLSFLYTPIYSAESVDSSKQGLFPDYKKKVLDIIDFGIEPLEKLDGVQNEEDLYNIVLSAEQNLAKSHLDLSELKVPIELPNDTRVLLGRSKEDLSTGLKALEEGMNYYAQYIVKRSPEQYDKYVKKRDKGIRYINGGLTTLTSAELQLDDPLEPIQSVWEVGKRNLYKLEKAIPVKGVSNDN